MGVTWPLAPGPRCSRAHCGAGPRPASHPSAPAPALTQGVLGPDVSPVLDEQPHDLLAAHAGGKGQRVLPWGCRGLRGVSAAGWAASPGAGLLLPTAQLWAWRHLSAEPEAGRVQRAAGKWALASSPLRADPPAPAGFPGPGALLGPPRLPLAHRPAAPAPAPALTKVDVVVGAEAESCACGSGGDAGPVGEQGSHQVHVLVQDGHVQRRLTWFGTALSRDVCP